MFKVEAPRDGILRLEMSGRLDAAQMRGALNAVIARMRETPAERVMLRLREIDVRTRGCLDDEARGKPELQQCFRRIRRAAVVSDQDWIRDQARVQAGLSPGVAIRGFAISAQDEAEAFLAAA